MSGLKVLLKEVKNALDTYSASNVDVLLDDETGMYDIMYCSRHNSFPIKCGVVHEDEIDKNEMMEKLDELQVGYYG